VREGILAGNDGRFVRPYLCSFYRSSDTFKGSFFYLPASTFPCGIMNRRGWKLAVALAIMALLSATGFTVLSSMHTNAQAAQAAPEKIDALLFYEKGCCKSCEDMEDYLKATLNQYYPDQVKSGMITSQVIDMKKDPAMVSKYNVKNWALKLVVTRNGQQSVVDVPEVWMYMGDKAGAMNAIKNAVDKQLGR
jgi:hypothetical protein